MLVETLIAKHVELIQQIKVVVLIRVMTYWALENCLIIGRK